LVVLVTIGFFAIGLLTQNALVVSFFNNYLSPVFGPIFNYQIGGVPLKYSGEYLGCVWENSFFAKLANPSSIGFGAAESSDIFDVCKQELLNADEIGCTECFDIGVDAPNQRILAGTGQSALYIMRIGAQQEEFCYTNLFADQECQPLTPAAAPKIFLKTNFGDKEPQTNLNLGGVLDPSVITDTPVTAVVTLEGDQFCDGSTTAIEASGVLEYTYRTEGSAPIIIRASGTDQTLFAGRNPISLPGPLKLDIIPDSLSAGGSYEENLNTISFLFIKLRNAGSGTATIKDLTLTQIFPETKGELENLGCAGPAVQSIETLPGSESDRTRTKITFGGQGIGINPSDRSSTILCQFKISGVDVPTGSSLTYIIIGEATYNYRLERDAPNIIVDQTACTQSQTGTNNDESENVESDDGTTMTKSGATGFPGGKIIIGGTLSQTNSVNTQTFDVEDGAIYSIKMNDCESGELGPYLSVKVKINNQLFTDTEGYACSDNFEYSIPINNDVDERTLQIESRNGWTGEYEIEITKTN
jgi:hypothetical protein